MKSLLAPAFVSALILASPAFAANPDVKETIVIKSNVVELNDGGTISIGSDGVTYHVDANGKRVRMKNGVVMTGKDGKKYLHKNDIIWQQIVEKGTLAPNR